MSQTPKLNTLRCLILSKATYHQCPLDKDSQLVTTFITPFRHYTFLRTPFGISSISEHYDRRMYEAFQGLHDFCRVVDDVVPYDEDLPVMLPMCASFCNDVRIATFHQVRDKLQFCRTEVHFAGFCLSNDSYHISYDITKAIDNFPTPSS